MTMIMAITVTVSPSTTHNEACIMMLVVAVSSVKQTQLLNITAIRILFPCDSSRFLSPLHWWQTVTQTHSDNASAQKCGRPYRYPLGCKHIVSTQLYPKKHGGRKLQPCNCKLTEGNTLLSNRATKQREIRKRKALQTGTS